MIQTFERCICDICGKEKEDRLELLRLKVFDSSITREPKQELDMCRECFTKLMENATPYSKILASKRFNLGFDEESIEREMMKNGNS